MSQQVAESSSRPAYVYRLRNADGEPLYIGSSYVPAVRYTVHQRTPWWAEVTSTTEERHDSRGAAYRAELAAILAEEPRHNIYGTSRESEAMRRRTETNRVRGAVQREGYRIQKRARADAESAGFDWRTARLRGIEAMVAHLDASSMFESWVERLRDQQRPGWAA